MADSLAKDLWGYQFRLYFDQLGQQLKIPAIPDQAQNTSPYLRLAGMTFAQAT